MDETKIPAPIPTAGGDVGTHLAYIRRDIDEIKRTYELGMKDIQENLHELKGVYVTAQQFKDSQDSMSKEIEETKELVGSMISKDEFDPVKKVVYGMVALVLLGVATALIALVIKK